MAQSSDAGESKAASGSGLIVAVVLGPSSLDLFSGGGALLGGGSFDAVAVGPVALGSSSLGLVSFVGAGSLGLAACCCASRGLVSLGSKLFDRGWVTLGAECVGDGVPLLTF